MKPEKHYDHLLHDIVDHDLSPEARDDILHHTLRHIRQRRRIRRTAGGVAAVAASALLLVALVSNPREDSSSSRPPSIAQATPSAAPVPSPRPRIAGTPIEIISDADLLNLFQDRPLALVGKGDHRQLIFLDETPSPSLQFP